MNKPISACTRYSRRSSQAGVACSRSGGAWSRPSKTKTMAIVVVIIIACLIPPVFFPICMLIQLQLTATCGGSPSWTSSIRCILVPCFVLFVLGCMYRRSGVRGVWGQCCDFGVGTGFNYMESWFYLMVMDRLVYLVYSRFLEHLVGAQSSLIPVQFCINWSDLEFCVVFFPWRVKCC